MMTPGHFAAKEGNHTTGDSVQIPFVRLLAMVCSKQHIATRARDARSTRLEHGLLWFLELILYPMVAVFVSLLGVPDSYITRSNE